MTRSLSRYRRRSTTRAHHSTRCMSRTLCPTLRRGSPPRAPTPGQEVVGNYVQLRWVRPAVGRPAFGSASSVSTRGKTSRCQTTSNLYTAQTSYGRKRRAKDGPRRGRAGRNGEHSSAPTAVRTGPATRRTSSLRPGSRGRVRRLGGDAPRRPLFLSLSLTPPTGSQGVRLWVLLRPLSARPVGRTVKTHSDPLTKI